MTFFPFIMPIEFTRDVHKQRVLHRYQQKIFLAWIRREEELLLNSRDPKLTTLPREVGLCEGLYTLNAGTYPPLYMWSCAAFCIYVALLRGKNPCMAYMLVFLLSLSLSDNNELRTVPGVIGNLFHLGVLVLSNNALSALPAEICLLRNLEVLDLHNNQINTLPPHRGAHDCPQDPPPHPQPPQRTP